MTKKLFILNTLPMERKLKKVILTGFKPFGDYRYNPTETSTKYYDTRTISGNEQIIGVVLPCTYFTAYQMLSKIIDTEKPDAIISTGLWSQVPGIQIETRFQNLMDGKYADASGYHPIKLSITEHWIGEVGERFLFTQSDNIFLHNVLKEGNIPVQISRNADAFICNALGYLTTKKIVENNLPIKNAFIHVPWTDDYASQVPGKTYMKKNHLYDAIELLVANI
jgi:pyroglutamyl-peptidase